MTTTEQLFDILKIVSAELLGNGKVSIYYLNGSTVEKAISTLNPVEKTKVISRVRGGPDMMGRYSSTATFLDGTKKTIFYYSSSSVEDQDFLDSLRGEKYKKILLKDHFNPIINDTLSNQQIAEAVTAANVFFDKVRGPNYLYGIPQAQYVSEKVLSKLSQARRDSFKVWNNARIAAAGGGSLFDTTAKFIDDAIDAVPILGTVAPVVALAESLKHPTETAAIAFTAGAVSVAAGAVAVEPVLSAPALVGPPVELAGTSLLETVIAGGEALATTAGTTALAAGGDLIKQQIKQQISGGATAPTGESVERVAVVKPVSKNNSVITLLTFTGAFLAAYLVV